MSIDSIMDTLTIACIFCILGFGVFISFKILNITDLTIEASYGFGAAIAAMICRKASVDACASIKAILPLLSILAAFLGGAVAGLITGLLHTKLKINSVLSGILTLTGFITVNLLVIKKAPSTSISLSDVRGAINLFPNNIYLKFIIMFAIVLIIGILLALFFKTKLGLSLRATGDNEQMAKTQCISTDTMKIFGLALSNGLVAMAGAFFVHNQACYSTQIEQGMMVVGVVTIIIGEIVILGKHNLNLMLFGIFVGSVIYRFIYAFVLRIPSISSSYLHLITAGLIVLIMVISKYISRLIKKKKEKAAIKNLSSMEVK